MLSKRLNTNNTIRFPIVILVIPPSFMAWNLLWQEKQGSKLNTLSYFRAAAKNRAGEVLRTGDIKTVTGIWYTVYFRLLVDITCKGNFKIASLQGLFEHSKNWLYLYWKPKFSPSGGLEGRISV
jgi:hypothetical protein